MKVLLLQEQQNLQDRVGFWLENEAKAKVVTKTTVSEAVLEIRDNQERTDLVIFDYQTNAIKEYRAFRKELGPMLPVILCLEGLASSLPDDKGAARTQIINRRELIDGIAQAMVSFKTAGALSDDAAEDDASNSEFCRIRTPLLLSVVPLKGDIYIRLSAEKFVKLFQQGDQFESSDYDKYTKLKGVEYLYLKRDAVEEFVVKYTEEIKKMLAGVDDIAVTAASEISVHQIVHELNKSVGFSPAVESLVQTQMRASVTAIEKTPMLRDILKKMQSLKGDYLHVHSVLTGHIACGLATEMSWAKNHTYQKMTMAGFLHDVALRDHKLARISTIAEFDSDSRGLEAKKDFLAHPTAAAELVNKFHEVPPDVDKIIVQHHERPDQSGFPHKLGGPRMSPLSCLFIIAHEMADYQIKGAGRVLDVGDFIRQASKIYNTSVYRKILEAVETCFLRR